MLSARGRLVRLLATGGVLVALLAGTFFGDDDSFPFGPFRMYSIANKTSGRITTTHLEGVTNAGGARARLGFSSFGLRRAEVEGQLPRFQNDPSQLELLVEAYANRNPDAPELTELYLVRRIHQLEGGRPVTTTETTIASWSRS